LGEPLALGQRSGVMDGRGAFSPDTCSPVQIPVMLKTIARAFPAACCGVSEHNNN